MTSPILPLLSVTFCDVPTCRFNIWSARVACDVGFQPLIPTSSACVYEYFFSTTLSKLLIRVSIDRIRTFCALSTDPLALLAFLLLRLILPIIHITEKKTLKKARCLFLCRFLFLGFT
ncbi:MAG: hypothetical protein [Cressdnaviricota sp.]|nr:MAG: hypothetical protein [Cressdnaviricota sp.]